MAKKSKALIDKMAEDIKISSKEPIDYLKEKGNVLYWEPKVSGIEKHMTLKKNITDIMEEIL